MRCKGSGIQKTGIIHILLTAAILAAVWAAGSGALLYHGLPAFACEAVYAGAEEDGSDSVQVPLPQIPEGDTASDSPITISYGTDADGTELTASERQMKPGETYDISGYKDATWLVAFQSGTYRIKGESEKTMLLIHTKATDDIRIIFGDDDGGVRMVATKHCPGPDGNARSPVRIEGAAGGKVTLVSAAGQTSYFRSKGGVSAIRKDSADVSLTFDTEDPDDPGTFEVHADKNAVRTSAIGCYSNIKTHNTFGNTVFKAGRILAYGSEGGWFGGGPGIGADMFGQVKGLTFEDAEVEAYAGCGASAAIGTASADVLFIAAGEDSGEDGPENGGTVGDEPDPFSNGDRFMGIACRNVTINGGSVKALHRTNISERQSGAAGIGGGWGGHSDSIVINGGKVKAEGTNGAAGIGGGNEGNCNGYSKDHKPKGYGTGDHGIIINGGEVEATGGASGIGSGYAEDMCMDTDKFRFGDCRILITGGKVTAEATQNGGTAIGGYKGDKYDTVMSIEISGGEVTANGPAYGVGIGCGSHGNLQKLKISGGIIHARTGKKGTSIGGDTNIQTNGFCPSVEITGGTIVTGIAGETGPGWIGGWKSVHITSGETTWVYISGGNVYGKIFQATARRDASGDVRVYCDPVSLKTYGLSSKYREYVPVEQLSVAGAEGDPEYGLNDVYTIAADSGNDPVLYLWLPEDRSVSAVSLKEPFLEYGLDLKKEDVRDFRGVTEPKEGGTLYPGFWFLFDDNYTIKDTSVSSAHAYIGSGKAEEGSFHPEKHTCADGSVISPAGYAVDKERQHLLLKADGTFVKGCEAAGTTWTDSSGRLLLTSADASGDDPRDMQNHYTHGIRLYAVWDQYELAFDPNRPRGASTQISGSMPAQIHGYDEKITVPECGYKLPGYRFKGWTLSADPGEADKVYQPGDEAEGTGLDPAQSGAVTFYAQWEPLDYTITLDSGDADQGMFTQDAVFDREGTLRRNNWYYTGHVFHGWTANRFGSFYEDGEEFCNLCTINEDGSLSGMTLTAEWTGSEEIDLTITKDGKPVEGLEDKIILSDGTAEFTLSWTFDRGSYRWNSSQGGLPTGWYHLMIRDDDYPVSENKGTFEYGSSEGVSLVLDYYTVKANGENEKISAYIKQVGGTRDPAHELVVPDDSPLLLEAKAAKGYHFSGYTAAGVAPDWDPSKAKQNVTVRGKADITAHAQANVYTVMFDANGGSGTMEDQDLVYDEPQRLNANRFSRNGYVFRGWNTAKDPGSGKSFDDHALINDANQDDLAPEENRGKVTLYAVWEPIVYSIEYDLDGGALPSGKDNPAVYTAEDSFTLTAPQRKDHDFAGWTGTGLKKPAVSVTVRAGSWGDRFYKANWKIKEFKVKFETGGGSRVAGQTVPIHQTARRPSDPAKAGFTFAGWYADRALTNTFDFSREIVRDTVVYAKWNKIPVYTVKFVTKGGSKVPDQTVQKGMKAKKPADPKKSGYSFAGWYTDKALTKGFDFSRAITGNMKLYARWTADPVPVLMAWGKPSGKRSVKTEWTGVPGASEYRVYAARCGNKLKRVKVTKNSSFRVDRIRGMKLMPHRPYILRVEALDKNGNVLAVSKQFHVITAKTMGNHANIRKITAKKKQMTLKKGQSAAVGAKYDLPKGKKHLNKAHGAYLRYTSDNPKVAGVTKNGKVKAKYPGTATIYIQDTSGMYCTTVITVR